MSERLENKFGIERKYTFRPLALAGLSLGLGYLGGNLIGTDPASLSFTTLGITLPIMILGDVCCYNSFNPQDRIDTKEIGVLILGSLAGQLLNYL